MHKVNQPGIDGIEDMFDACYGSAVYLNNKAIDEALKIRLAGRTPALDDAGTTRLFNADKGEPAANQAMHKRTKKAA